LGLDACKAVFIGKSVKTLTLRRKAISRMAESC
jgi:hypothetical protein